MPHDDSFTEPTDKLGLARERFKRCSEAEDKQRKVMLACKQFRALNQWPDEVKIQRQGGPAITGQAAQPPRPMLTIDRISQPTRQVSNSVKAANFSINVQPNGYGADDETAAIYKGLLRWIQNRARAEAPVDWAADGAAEGGLGWFRIRSDYSVNEPSPDGRYGPEYGDQDLCLERITNNLTVYCDPSAQKPTRSDAKFMFVTEDVPVAEFKRRWPKANISRLDEFRGTGDNNGWVTEDTVRVAEYWYIEFDTLMLQQLMAPDGQSSIWVPKSEVPKDVPKESKGDTRKVFTPRVECCTITATEELESYDWLGRRIPLFPIIGEELNVDGQIVLRGVIAPAMDAQRMVNYMYSGAIEAVALAPKAPFIIAEGQVERYKDIWQNLNRFNYSYAPYTPVSLLGVPVPPPQRDQAEAAGLQSMVIMLERSEDAIKATTGIYDPSLGNTNPREKSGRAIMALQKQSELGQSNYIDNVITALTDAGDELVYLLPKYYDRPGRVVQILGIDDQPEQVMLGQPYQNGPQGPQAMQGVSPEMAKMQKGLAKFYDLKTGKYAVTVTVGKSHTTKREEGSSAMLELVQAQPQLLQVFGDLLFRDLDFPGAQEVSERMKKMLAPQVQQGKEGEPNPQQLQQQMQQMGTLIQHLSEELEHRVKQIETEQVKSDRDVALEGSKQAAETQRLQMEIAAKAQLERLKLAADLLKTRATLEVQQTEAMIDREVALLDSSVAAAGEQEARQAQAEQADMDRQHEASMGEADRQMQVEQAASIEP